MGLVKKSRTVTMKLKKKKKKDIYIYIFVVVITVKDFWKRNLRKNKDTTNQESSFGPQKIFPKMISATPKFALSLYFIFLWLENGK